MKYRDLLVERYPNKEIEVIEITETGKAEDVLRSNGFKIKLITPTKFGTQIDLAKNYEKEEIEKVLKDFKFKMSGRSIFVE
jgi:hypothetical protein